MREKTEKLKMEFQPSMSVALVLVPQKGTFTLTTQKRRRVRKLVCFHVDLRVEPGFLCFHCIPLCTEKCPKFTKSHQNLLCLYQFD